MTGNVPKTGQDESPIVRKLDDKATAAAIKARLAKRAKALRAERKALGLGAVLVGEDPELVSYVVGKHRDCVEVDIESIREDLPASASQEEIVAAVERLSTDPTCTAHITQLPLLRGASQSAVFECIGPNKDANDLRPTSLGRLVLSVGGEVRSLPPCAPAGILELLSHCGVSLRGKNIAIVGCRVTVGRSIGLLLTRYNINVAVVNCHTGTANVEEIVRRTDVVIAAAGMARLVTPEWIKPDAVVVDVGASRIIDPETRRTRIVGDAYPDVAEVAAWLLSSLDGIRPVTRAILLADVVDIAERKPCAQ